MTTATISKDFTFAAAHRLTGIPPEHQCARGHGHNYLIRAEITGEIIDPGWVVDYGELKGFGAWLDEHLDHRDLNEQIPINTTAENLADHLIGVLRGVLGDRLNVHSIGVGVSETPKSWAWIREPW